MTANPNSDSEEVREKTQEAAPASPPESTPETTPEPSSKNDDEERAPRAAAAEVLPTPAAPRLSTEYDPDSIVNFDYLEEEGQEWDLNAEEMLSLINQYEETLTDIQEGQILKGTVIEVRDNEVLLNIGFKSEGVISREEFGSTSVAVNDTFDVFLEKLENLDGLVVLSKERADFLKVWDRSRSRTRPAMSLPAPSTGESRVDWWSSCGVWIRSCPAARLHCARFRTWRI